MKYGTSILLMCLAIVNVAQGNAALVADDGKAIIKEIQAYPGYMEVVEKFFSEYKEQTYYTSFEKSPDGWFVTLKDYYTGEEKIAKRELYWSKKNKKFLELSFKKRSDSLGYSKDAIERYSGEREWYRSPYYGYIGWEMDVINTFGTMQELPDEILYGLGRAYSSYAHKLIPYTVVEPQSFDLPQGQNSMNAQQLAEHRKYAHAAINCFEKVKDRNPSFETLVGEIRQKWANEHVVTFLQLRIFQNEEEALRELPENIYDDFYLSTAKNYLNSCAQDAILFTHGDNDTYPLLYVQAKHGVRKDVLIVNLSLLGTDRYINHLKNGVPGSGAFPVTLFGEKVIGPSRNAIYFEGDNEEYYDLKEMIEFVSNDSNMRDGVFYLPYKRFQLSTNTAEVIQWKWESRYLVKNELMMLDIISTNNWERPIYFAISVDPASLMGLGDYLETEGLAKRLVKEKRSYRYEDAVNTTVLYENFMNRFDWNWEGKLTILQNRMALNYTSTMNKLTEELIRESKNEMAKQVLDLRFNVISNDAMYFGASEVFSTELYYQLGDFESGNRVALTIIDNIKNNRYYFTYEGEDYREKMKYTILMELERQATMYKQQVVLDALGK